MEGFRGRTVRYVRCEGPRMASYPPSGAAVLIRIEHEGDQARFGGYVVLSAEGKVLEKSNTYGQFEGDASWVEAEDECVPASRGDFKEAWDRPYARRSLWRQFLSSLNGTDDRHAPDDGPRDTARR